MLTSTLHPPGAAVIAPAVGLRDVRKVHGKGDGAVVALDGVTVGLARGSFTAIMGPSGSGKSTFLNVAAGRDPPTSRPLPRRGAHLAPPPARRPTPLGRPRSGALFPAFPPPPA